ncbi:MAG: alanyl-tRNA editing protein [Thermoplasmata archaeon]
MLSKVVYNEFGAQVSGNQIYADRARMDFTLENLTPEIIQKTEQKANEIISQNRKINILFVDRNEAIKKVDLKRTRIDLLPQEIKNIRLVEIENFDIDACAGTHVRNTSEIGRLKIVKTENKGKGKRRIEIILE